MKTQTENRYNRITLNFTDKNKEKLFRHSYFEKSKYIFRVSFVVATLLYLSFGFFDRFVTEEHLYTFFHIRFAIVLPLLLGTVLLSFGKHFQKYWQGLLMICFIVTGAGVIYMVSKVNINRYYFSGLFLIFISGFFFIRLRFLKATISSIILIALYVLAISLHSSNTQISELDIYLSSSFYIAMAFLGSFAAYYIEKLERKEFSQQMELMQQKAEIIDAKNLLELKVEERTLEISKAKETILESQQQYKALYDHAPLGYQSLDALGYLIDVNPMWCKILMYEKNEVLGKWFGKFLHSDSKKDFEQEFKSFLKRGYIHNVHLKMIRKDQTFIFVSFEGAVRYNSEGKAIQTYCTFKDITHELEIKNELIEAKEKAEESDRLKSAFLANMSHEIRTPLNGILGFSDLLLDSEIDLESRKMYTNIIQKNGQRLMDTVNDIIDISKIESGQMDIHVGEIDLSHEIDPIAAYYQKLAKEKGLEFIYRNEIPANNTIFHTDSFKLKAIINSLLKNAIKFTSKGRIELHCSRSNNFLDLSVSDTGIGIPPNRLDAIFKRFEQADIYDKKAHEGSGLGLAISKSYTTMLQGKIRVESKQKEGSTFFISLPNQNKQMKKSYSPVPEITNTDAQIQHLLIAEDDDYSYQHLAIILRKKAKIIHRAKNGQQAVELFKSHPIDLVLMDLKMPDMNGHEAAIEIFKLDSSAKIIAQTAFVSSEEKEKCLKNGFKGYISKPIIKNELFFLINKTMKAK